ncbi:cell division protein ZapE [Rhodoluna sp.]|uniref:cell division protein ZapE n=1 Tax=Rhodoluna sp. TaxID=1969481 RepID=UPI0025D54860|nr:cell division protein ZapE [Rhodoluna sp.]
MAIDTSKYGSLIAHNPKSSVSELLADLVPPREFVGASFETYKPHAEFDSQAKAMLKAQKFASGKTERKLFGKSAPVAAGIYLDGGFGVGKTHLLASIWHAFKGPKAFGSFIAYTSLIGALGFAQAVTALAKFELICIDEFELDDPGDTMMMSRLLNELEAKGVRFAATSNTPPNALGEGRFAASDFQREIHGISDRFDMLRIDGEDYRHRPVDFESRPLTEAQLEEWLQQGDVSNTTVDDFERFLMHLSTIHPSRYGRLLQGVNRVAFKHVYQLNDQVDALRFVAFVDRAYEAQIHMRGTGTSLTDVFSPEYLGGGFRKKYLRAVSRLGAMTV